MCAHRRAPIRSRLRNRSDDEQCVPTGSRALPETRRQEMGPDRLRFVSDHGREGHHGRAQRRPRFSAGRIQSAIARCPSLPRHVICRRQQRARQVHVPGQRLGRLAVDQDPHPLRLGEVRGHGLHDASRRPSAPRGCRCPSPASAWGRRGRRRRCRREGGRRRGRRCRAGKMRGTPAFAEPLNSSRATTDIAPAGFSGSATLRVSRTSSMSGPFEEERHRPQRRLCSPRSGSATAALLLAAAGERDESRSDSTTDAAHYVPVLVAGFVVVVAGARRAAAGVRVRQAAAGRRRCASRSRSCSAPPRVVSASTTVFWNASDLIFVSSSGLVMNATSTSAAGIVAPTSTLNGACFTPRF